MPRQSPYRIVLSADEARTLTARAAQYTRPYFEVLRAKMMLLAAEGWSNDAITRRLSTRREVVSHWRKRFFEERVAGLEDQPRSGGPELFPPEVVVTVDALACELPGRVRGSPLARWSLSEWAAGARRSGLVASISGSTIWRWLDEDAIRPWCHRSWIFPATRTSPARPVGSSISTSASGTASRSRPTSS